MFKWIKQFEEQTVETIVSDFHFLITELESLIDFHEENIIKVEDEIGKLVAVKEAALKEQFRASSIAAKLRDLIN